MAPRRQTSCFASTCRCRSRLWPPFTLFSAVGHWNSWFDAILFLSRSDRWPVQAYAYDRLIQQGFKGAAMDASTFARLPDVSAEGLNSAFIVFIAFPIMCIYPFLQRYFRQGTDSWLG